MSERKPVLLLAFANDQQESARYLRGLAQELRGIRQALTPARQAGAIEIVERANASLGDIIDVFQDPEYQGRIQGFHYGGHADSYQLLLESESGGVQIANSEGFSQFLANQQGLQFVFLNGCSTRDQAMDLRAAGIPTVIATSDVINDDIARRIAVRFYKGLGGYASLAKSFVDATSEILTITGANNYRSLYFEEVDNPPQSHPWQIYPDPPHDWRLKIAGQPQTLQIEDIKIGKYAHVLCNRYRQNDEFVSSHIQSLGGQPHVYIIHGHRDEKHESLITRFSYEHIGTKEQYLRPVEIKNWPFKGDVETLLKVRLAEHFDSMNHVQKSVEAISAAEILRQTAHSGREAIILQHNIPAEYWNKGTADLIRWYIGDFWKIRSPQPESPQFVIFLNVMYSGDVKEGNLVSKLFSKSYYKSKIVKEIQAIADEFVGYTTLLTELNRVRRTHVEDWLIETNLAELDDFAVLPDSIFGSGNGKNESLTMARVELKLKEAVNHLRQQYVLR
ncbi:MAG: hypothetical protein AAF587_38210 [Bacteroidota bacterium]